MAKKGYSFGALVDFVESLQWKTNWAIPVGAILPFPKEPLPIGFLKLDGSKFDRNVYKDLYEFLGTDVLPNFTNLTPKMVGSDLAALQIKSWEWPQHNHTWGGQTDTQGAHTHTRGNMEISGNVSFAYNNGGGSNAISGAFGVAATGKKPPGGFDGSGYATSADFYASRTWTGETSSNGAHTHHVSGTTSQAGNSTKVEVDRIGVIYAIKAYGHVEEGYEVEFASLMQSIRDVQANLDEHKTVSCDYIKMLSTENLNDVVQTGLYHNNLNANASTDKNYPVAYAGELEVLGEHGGTMVFQRYTKYNDGTIFVRNRYNNNWGAWYQQAKKSDVDALFARFTFEY